MYYRYTLELYILYVSLQFYMLPIIIIMLLGKLKLKKHNIYVMKYLNHSTRLLLRI